MSRSKNRRLADIVSGTTFDDGVVSASEVTGLHTVASTGSFRDLSEQPTPFDPDTLAAVATSGGYGDLTGKPTLGTAAASAIDDYATAAQGTKADSAIQAADIGTAAATAATAYATAAQGTKADSAIQSADLADVATSGGYGDLTGTPTLITNNNQLTNGAAYITSYTDTNTTYTADGDYGMTLSGTTFRLEDDRRRDSSTTDVYSGNAHDYTFYDASVGIKWFTAGAEEMRLENDGDLHVDGNIVAYSTTVSDERLKTDIVKIDGALAKVDQLNGYTFTYIADGKKSAGVIAQEVHKVMPCAIVESKLPLKMGDGNETEYMTVQYDQLIGLLIEAVKELKAEVTELKGA